MDATLRLQSRDLALTELLDEHRTLTTGQIAQILFPSRTAAEHRLYRLRAMGWLNRFTAIRAGGRLDTHWVLDQLAAEWAAPRAGRTPPTAKAGRERRAAIAASSQLEHLDGANQFFVDLLAVSRHDPNVRLTRWWSAARTASALGQRVRPDGHGVWAETSTDTGRTVDVGFFLEYDTGTEPLDRLQGKVEAYQRLRRDGGPDYPVLFWLPSQTREANFHRKLNGSARHLEITVATASMGAQAEAAAPLRTTTRETTTGPIWKVAGNGRSRHRLADLPSRHGKPGAPFHPGVTTPEEGPLRMLV